MVKPLPQYVRRIDNAAVDNGEEVGGFNVWPTAHPRINVEREERLTISFRIRPKRPESGVLSLPEAASGNMALRRDSSGAEYWLDVNIGPYADGRQDVPVNLPVANGLLLELRLMLGITVLSDNLVVTPNVLDLGEVSLAKLKSGQSAAARIGVRWRVGLFHLKGVSSTLPFLKLEPQAVVEGSNYVVRVSIDFDQTLTQGSLSGTLRIQTDDEKHPFKEIPFKITFVQ